MPSLSLLLLLLWGLGSHGFPATLETQEHDEDLVRKYLENYYNLKSGIDQFRRQRKSGPVVEKLKQMQKFFGLEVTGKPDAETLKVMKKPRCGVPDVGFIEFTHGSYHWPRLNLTYRIKSYTQDLSREDVDHAIGKAFELWSNATDLTFTKVFEGEADIMLSFVWGNHGDNSPFYGRGSYHLAHAFPPGQHLGGDIHFNDDETWTKDFRSSKYWITKGNQLLYRYPRDIYSSFGFPESVKRIDAAVHEEETGKTHFFVANEHWRYDENRRSMDVGYPKKITDSFPGIGTKVDAVFHDKGFFYVFQGTKQYVLNPKTKEVLNLLPSNSWLNCRNN
ncbi:interstitial collagenase-like [Eulemur rufifrons]|uniref:interstitial collagenase-like n=1 Tax=Eulemur rufifrons TaxID=859984 RepID=UPI0037443B65